MVFLLSLLLWLVAGRVAASSTSNQTIANYTGLLLTTGGTPDPLAAQADYQITNPTAGLVTGTFRLGLRLVDENGSTVGAEVFTTPATLNLLPHAVIRGSATLNISLPAGRIQDGAPYTIASRLYSFGGNPKVWTPLTPDSQGSPYRFTLADRAAGPAMTSVANLVSVERNYALATAPALASFPVRVQGTIARWDLSLPPGTVDPFTLFLTLHLTGAAAGDVTLSASRFPLPATLGAGTPGGAPSATPFDQTLDLIPALPIDPGDTYAVTVDVSMAGPDGVELPGNSILASSQRLLYFKGRLVFGGIEATVNDLSNVPVPLGTDPAGGEHTSMGIPPGGAVLSSAPAYTFGTAKDLAVLLGTDGTATTSDSVDVLAPAAPDIGTIAGIRFLREQITLDGAGFHARGRVFFPAGFGVGTGPNVRRLMADYPTGTMDLDPSFNPVGVVQLSPASIDRTYFYGVHEQLPEMFQSDGIAWDVASGTLTLSRLDTLHVRRDFLATLAGLPLVPENFGTLDRPSNDGYLLAPDPGTPYPVVVRADDLGRAVLANARLDLPPSSFTPHFPIGLTVGWGSQGALVIQDGAIDPAQSSLPGAADVSLNVFPGAPAQTLAGGIDTYQFSPAEATWGFTPDGGLRAEGAATMPALRWGTRDGVTFAQTTDPFLAADAQIPGPLLRGSVFASTEDVRPGILLLSGHGRPGDPGYLERPQDAAYALGLADYPGINLRVDADGAINARSLVGDALLGPYPLRATSKYYLRLAGVSGVHAAVSSAIAAMAGALQVYGFPMTLTDYQIAQLDNTLTDSRIRGTVTVPGVFGTQGFTQPFDKLWFDNAGQLTHLGLPSLINLEHPLSYWHAQFHPLSAEFLTHPTNPSRHALVFGAEVHLPAIVREPVRGGLGFYSDGRMVAGGDGFPGVNSRLKPPKQISLHGTRSAIDPTHPGFTLHPVSDLYFNNPDEAAAGDPGFVSVAGTVKVPFFQDLQVQLIARANGGQTAVRAGWPAGNPGFFTDARFDANNRGYPAGMSLADYENDAEPDALKGYFNPDEADHRGRNPFNVAARQSWLGVVNFELPVRWDPIRRRFLSSIPEQRNFLVLNSQRVVQQLTPSGADIRFGIQFNQLPRLNLAALVVDEGELSGELLKFIPNGEKLAASVRAFDKLLNNQSDELVAQGLDLAIDAFLDDLLKPGGPLAGAVSKADALDALGVNNLSANFTLRTGELQARLKTILGTATEANSIMGELQQALNDVGGGLEVADELLQKDKDGKRGVFIGKAIDLATSVGLPAQDLAPVASSLDSLINGDLATTLDEVQTLLDQVHGFVSPADSILKEVQSVVDPALAAANSIGSLPDQVLAAMRDHVAGLNDPTGRLMAEMDPGVFRAELKRVAHGILMQSQFITELQEALREAIEPVHEDYGAAFDQIFGALNNVVRTALQELSDQVVDHLNDDVGKVNRAIGGFSETLQMTKVEGSARIIGDVLDSAHINGSLGLNVPDPITLAGSVDFKRIHTDQPTPKCAVGAADGRMQITVKATGSANIAGGPSGHASAEGQYTMTSDGSPLAVTGKLSVESDLHFDIVNLKRAELDFAFGKYDNYLRAEGAGSILLFDVQTRCFLGRTCDLEVLRAVDPLILDVFTKLGITKPDPALFQTVTGYYFRGDGDVVLNRILGIPDSVVTLKAKGGQGSFAFCNDDLSKVIPGMHWRLGLTVGLGPVTADATLEALGGLDPMELLKKTSVADITASLFLNPGLIHGVVAGNFSPSFGVGPASYSRDFHFTALGRYTPPPLAPPPGIFFVNQLDF
ncbi:MAG TPA: hypothetical protein DCM86_20480 [Verrucomicrobiales bacterium]|nr:hypothetical protein [Verrucomicrobiales bacterium]